MAFPSPSAPRTNPQKCDCYAGKSGIHMYKTRAGIIQVQCNINLPKNKWTVFLPSLVLCSLCFETQPLYLKTVKQLNILQQDPAMVEQISKNITRQGLTNYTLNFLRVSHYRKILTIHCVYCKPTFISDLNLLQIC